jgi:hypothetical protein
VAAPTTSLWRPRRLNKINSEGCFSSFVVLKGNNWGKLALFSGFVMWGGELVVCKNSWLRMQNVSGAKNSSY